MNAIHAGAGHYFHNKNEKKTNNQSVSRMVTFGYNWPEFPFPNVVTVPIWIFVPSQTWCKCFFLSCFSFRYGLMRSMHDVGCAKHFFRVSLFIATELRCCAHDTFVRMPKTPTAKTVCHTESANAMQTRRISGAVFLTILFAWEIERIAR